MSARDAGDDDAPARLSRPVGNRWAVIVGVSDYADDRLELKYAHADAEALRDFLLTPAGGAYSPERIALLLDRNATRDAVTRAIRSFLGGTRDQDLALLFFACHGAADAAGKGEPLYLLTADTDYDDIAGTALPMDEIDWGLRNYVRAERVVIIADTCHSAGIRSGARGGDELSAGALNTYLEQLGASSPGIAYLTSARAHQKSYEDAEWGGGHGAFTHFLLEGLSGAADGHGGRPRDNVVTLEELAGYVRARVYEATKRKQEPILGSGRYDPELPLAVVGGLDVEAKLRLARALMEVGWLLDDPGPFLCADRETLDAQRLAGLAQTELPEAVALSGEARLAAREYGPAATVLRGACERYGVELAPSAWLHLGLALAGQGETEGAAEQFEEFARRAPADPEAAWAADYAAWLRGAGGRTRALLIGVGEYEREEVPPLHGPPNDVTLLRELLIGRVGVDARDLVTLVDAEATRAAIEDALARMAADAEDGDVALVYFSGHADAAADGDRPYLIAHDADGDTWGGLSVTELHSLVRLIPARARLLVLDTHGNEAFNALMAERPVATVLAASAPGQMAYEDGGGPTPQGAFTAALVATWSAAPDPREVTWQELRAGAEERLRARFGQVPVLLGAPAGGILEGAFPAASMWHESRARGDRAPGWRGVRAAMSGRWPRRNLVAARADAAAGLHGRATELLLAWAKQHPDDPWPWVDAARSAVATGASDGAEAALERFARVDGSARWGAAPTEALKAVRALREARGRALLVGVGRHADGGVPDVAGAHADVVALREALLARGFAGSDMTVLEDADATREAIVAGLRGIVAAKDELAVCFIAANGSRAGGEPSLVPYDGRAGGAADLTIGELAALGRPDLVTIVDAGLGHAVTAAGARSVATAELQLAAARDIGAPQEEELPVVGGVMLLAVPGAAGSEPPPREHGGRGILTRALLDALEDKPANYAAWAAASATELPLAAVGAQAERPVLHHHTRLVEAQWALDVLAYAPAHAAIELAQQETVRSRERNEPCPAAWLELGLAHAAAGRPREAIRHLRSARNLYDDPTVRAAEARRDPSVDYWQREARFHLGRLLHEHDESPSDFAEAVAALEHARAQAPGDPRIMLHLGLAIRAQAERQNLVEATRLLRAYVDAGAPLGRLDEIRAFLDRADAR